MSDLGERLERLGLYQYFEVFVVEGFDTWNSVLDITESDLDCLDVKLGHRRKLQRAIAELRQSADRLLPTRSSNQSTQVNDFALEGKARPGEPSAAGATRTSTKRKYRRHPKIDEYAPERSSSAYVIFSNRVRETLKGQELSFTEIAKVVGERWQVLPVDAREAYERQANAAKEKYDAQLVEYKKTPQYYIYQKYLGEFHAKQAATSKEGAEGKRSKLETDTNTSTLETRVRRDEQMDWIQDRGVSSIQLDPLTTSHHITDANPPIGPIGLPSGSPYLSNATSPVAHPLPVLNSSRMSDHYSSSSAAPSRSAATHKKGFFDMHFLARDDRGHSDPSMPYPPTTCKHAYQHTPITPPAAYSSYRQAPIDLPSRRSFCEPSCLPPLVHEDTILSSSSGDSGYHTTANPTSFLPIIDTQKLNRMLPHPVPNMGATRSPLDRHPLPASSPQARQDYRATYSFGTLLNDKEIGKDAFL